jgi:hypothetical protein
VRISHIKLLNGEPFFSGEGEPCGLCKRKIEGGYLNYIGNFIAEGATADMHWEFICRTCLGEIQSVLIRLRKTTIVKKLTRIPF